MDMEKIKTALGEIVTFLAGNTEITIDKAIILFVGFAVLTVVFQKTGKALESPVLTYPRSIILAIIAIVAILLVTVPVKAFLAPSISMEALKTWSPLIAAVIGVFAIIAPAGWLLQKTGYVRALITVSVGFIAALIVVFLLGYGFSTVRSSVDSMGSSLEDQNQKRAIPK